MIVVVGLGSMGKRRIRLLKKIRPNDEIVGVDSNIERCNCVAEEMGISVVADLAVALLEKPKFVLVCTSPLSHADIISKCLKAGANVFTEINLVDNLYEENLAMAKENGVCLYLSSTPIFRSEMRYITNRVWSYREKVNYTYHVGQYLPDWHPWESYKNFFIGNKKTNGCREILAIELPWMVKCFGEIEDIKYISGRTTKLGIDYNDGYFLLISHKNGAQGMFAVDVVCRKPVRNLRVYGEELFISWDGTTEGLLEYDIASKEEQKVNLYESVEHLKGYNSMIIENAYESELLDFFEAVEGKKNPEYSFELDKKILGWIDKVEENV